MPERLADIEPGKMAQGVRAQGRILAASLVVAFLALGAAVFVRAEVSQENCSAINEVRHALVLILRDAQQVPPPPGVDEDARHKFYQQSIDRLHPIKC